MQIYKALISDLDGTAVKLASDGSDVNELLCEAIKQAQRKDILITCATGRRWNIAKPVISSLGITSPCIIEGGTRIIDPVTEEVLWEKPLETSSLELMLDVFKTTCPAAKLYTEEINGQLVDEIKQLKRGTRFVYLLGLGHDIAAKLRNDINVQKFAVAHCTPSWSGADKLDVHVTHREATKQHAVEIWQEIHNVAKAQTIAVGDSGNDIPLFQSAGFSIAVSNATPDLKELANYITRSPSDMGLIEVIKKFL